MMLRLAMEFGVMVVLMALVFWLGYRRGYRVAYDTKLSEALENARRRRTLTPHEAEVLGLTRPRSRAVRIKGTSRRGLGD